MATPPPLYPRTRFFIDTKPASGSTFSFPVTPEPGTQGRVQEKIERFDSLRVSKPLPPVPEKPRRQTSSHNGVDEARKDDQRPKTALRVRRWSLQSSPSSPVPHGQASQMEHVYEELDAATQDSREAIPPPVPPPVPPKPPRMSRSCSSLSLDGAQKRTPPPLPQKLPLHLRRTSLQLQQTPEYLEIIPDHPITRQLMPCGANTQPAYQIPRWPAPEVKQDTEELELMTWWNSVRGKESIYSENDCVRDEDTNAFRLKAHKIHKVMRFYNSRFSACGETLQKHVDELLAIAENLDRVTKNVKITAITGGTTGALGGAAAVAGLALAPVTMGATLAMTAVGLGVMAAGGVTGASAAILNAKSKSSDRKKLEQTVQEYSAEVCELDQSLRLIGVLARQLEFLDVSSMTYNDWDDIRMAELAVFNSSFISAAARSSGILQRLAEVCKDYEDNHKLKKEHKSKAVESMNVKEFAQQLQDALGDLKRLQEIFYPASVH